MSDTPYSSAHFPRSASTEVAAMVEEGAHTHRRISWAAIFGGAIIAVVMQALFSMLGAGIGLGTVNMNAGGMAEVTRLGMGTGIWWLVSSCVALFLGSFAAAWLAGIEIRFDGILHGLITWGVTTMLAIYLVSSAAGNLIGGGFAMLGNATTAAGSAAAPMMQASGITPQTAQQQVQALLQPANPDPASMSPQQAARETATDLVTYERGGPDAAAAHDRIVAIMAAQQKISPADAGRQFDTAQARMQQTMQTAKNAADAAASAASKASFAAFGVLLLGAICAAVGGSLAVQRRRVVIEREAR